MDPILSLKHALSLKLVQKFGKKNHVPENSIAIIPPEGYPHQKNYSIKAVRWIQSEAMTWGIEIKHALNGGEQRINGHYVDGYHEESRNHI